MGSIYSREVLGRKNPRVGILSIGTEDSKGNELTLKAFKLCRRLDVNFIGNVEGHDLFKDHVDVVVCDGFVGNMVLKTCESLAVAVFSMLKRELIRNPKRQLGAYLAQNAFQAIRRRMDPEVYGGAPLLGFNGIVFKAHGSARERAIASALRVTAETVQQQVNQIIAREIARANERLAARNARRRSCHRMSASPAAKPKNPRARHDFQGRACSITGVGSYVPAKILTNSDLGKMVDTSDEWITTRTGIKERRVAARDEFTSDMAAQAAQRAMKMAGVTAAQIDLIIVATITPDMPFPSTACLVQQKIGAQRAAAFDIEAACSGFIYAPGNRPAVHHVAHLRHRARHRRGKTFLDCGLEGPQHLRVVRRRRGRGGFAEPARFARFVDRGDGSGRRQGRFALTCPAAAAVVRPRRIRWRHGMHYLRMDGRGNLQKRRAGDVQGRTGSIAAVRIWTSRKSNASSRTRPTAGSLTR